MTDLMPEPVVDLDALADGEPAAPAAAGPELLDAVDEQLIDRLVGRAREGGLALTGEGGLLAQLTKRLVESALEGELTDHLGYGCHDAAGRDGGNSRNGRRSKTVLTEVGPVEIDVPRGTGTAASNPRSCPSALGACPESTSWSSRCPRRASRLVRCRPTWPRSTARRCPGRPSRRSPTR